MFPPKVWNRAGVVRKFSKFVEGFRGVPALLERLQVLGRHVDLDDVLAVEADVEAAVRVHVRLGVAGTGLVGLCVVTIQKRQPVCVSRGGRDVA